MTDWRDEVKDALSAFMTVAELAGERIAEGEITVEYQSAPHRPPRRLPRDHMAVYGFWGDGSWLKIGQVGPKSNARYTSQHYTGSAQSTLAGSLAGDPHMLTVAGFNSREPGFWIKAATHRVNILLPSRMPRELLSLLEAFLHLRLRPRYEG